MMKENFLTIFLITVAIITVIVAVRKTNQGEKNALKPVKTIENWESIFNKNPEHQNSENYIIIFFDYECPYCATLEVEINELINSSSSKLNVSYFHRPLKGAKNSFMASLAAECARDQGRFLEYHSLLYKHSFELGKIQYSDLAKKIEINDLSKFNNCVEGQKKSDIVKKQMRIADSLGINAVPTIIIDGQLFEGLVSSDFILNQITD